MPAQRSRQRPTASAKALCLALTLVASLLGPARPAGALVAQEARERARSEAVRAARALGAALREEASLPGFALAAGGADGIVLSEAFGHADLETRAPATPLTRWRIGSISKSLTAAGTVLLAERGALGLDATVAELLPGWDRRPAARATARQLAGHLGGIRHYREGEGIGHTHYESVADALELFADDSLVAPPGETYRYSTYGYVLLSALVARAAEEPFLAFIRREVFEPLGMRHTGPDLATRVVPGRASFYEIRDGDAVPAPFTDNSYKWAGGGLLSTPEDLVRFGSGLLDDRLLSPASVETLFTSQRTAAGEETGYGMGFRPRSDREGRRVVHHGGSSEGGRAFLLLYPDEGLVVAMAANRGTAPLFEEEAQTFAHFLLDHGPTAGAELDGDLAGAWALTATMGEDMKHEGSLRLHAGGRIRGMLELGGAHAPVRIVAVDRHGEELRLVGAGAHGVMNAWLRPAPGGWTGRWEYFGLSGDLILRETAPASTATCSLHEPIPAEAAAGAALARARRALTGLRPVVRFTNAALPPMSLEDRMARYRVPGVAVAVIDGGRPVWTCVAGVKRAGRADPVTRETLFGVKSVSKPVSAVAALRLVESGALSLDEPLSTRLVSYRIPRNEHTRATEPTLRHLLRHAAGFTRGGVDSYEPGEPLPTLEESLEGRPPADVEPLDVDFTPGTRSRYSGGGYGVLQALLQDVAGRAFPDVVDSLVLTHLGMRHSLFPQPLPPLLEPFSADGHFSDGTALPGGYEVLPILAAGGLWSTAPDLARFVVAVSGAWSGESDAFLDHELAREMLTRQAGGRGLGFEVEESGGALVFHHGGSGDGFKALFVGLPAEGAGAVILANGDGGGELRYELLRAIADEYDWPAYRETASHTLATDVGEEDLRRFEGTYVWNSGIASKVELRDGALHERFDEGEWTRLFPLSPTDFVSLMDVRYRFLPGLAGSYTLEMTDETGTYYAIPPQRLAEGVEGWRVVAPGGPPALDSIRFRAMGTGVHTTADASALYFHPDGFGRVPYEVGATFAQFGEPGSDEGLGLMIAGVETESGSLRHLLFRVRADGAYAIEVRNGGETVRTIRPWTRHEAVASMTGQGGRNALRVRVGSDQVAFSVNEAVVTTVPSEELAVGEGLAGFFVGRAHDVHVDGFGVGGTVPAHRTAGGEGTS